MATESKPAFERIYEIVRRIPPGRVATYGQISRMLDGALSAQFVGWALHGLTEKHADVPWHRVVNAKGGVSTRQIMGYAPDIQKHLLVEEGIEFDEDDHCDLDAYSWEPEPREENAGERPPATSRAGGRAPRSRRRTED